MRATINYRLPVKSEVELFICNVAGQKIMKLFEGHQESGHYTINLDKRLEGWRQLSAGVYFVVLKAKGYSIMKKILFVK